MLNELKNNKFSIITLACLVVIVITVLTISIENEQMISYTKHSYNQASNNFDGITMQINLTKENHEDHVKELHNQDLLLNNQTMIVNATQTESKLLSSINKTIYNMFTMIKNQTTPQPHNNNSSTTTNTTNSTILPHPTQPKNGSTIFDPFESAIIGLKKR
ncbi:MAG: hypothetical protein ACTHME_03330 [Candidatus Nitrosocosmicus sp.]